MQIGRDANPNRIEADIKWQDTQRQGCQATRGALNLGTTAPFGHYVHKDDHVRLNILLVAAVVVLVLGFGAVNFVDHVLNQATVEASQH